MNKSQIKFFDLVPKMRTLKSTNSTKAIEGAVNLCELADTDALDDSEVKKYWSDQFFTIFDSNRDGVVDFEELVLGIFYIKSQPSQQKAEFLFNIINRSGNGKISPEEILELHDLLFRGFRSGFLVTVRRLLEENPKLSNLPQIEVQDLMKTIEQRIDKLEIPKLTTDRTMAKADLDNDGFLNFDEYYFFVTDVKTRKKCEKAALTEVAPLLDNLLNEAVDLIKQKFSKYLILPTPR